MIEAPEETIALFRSFLAIAARGGTGHIHIDHSAVKLVDYEAETLLAALVLEAKRAYGTHFSGTLPTDLIAKEIVCAAGLPRILGAPSLPNSNDFQVFPLTYGQKRTVSAFASTDKERAATAAVEYVDRCLTNCNVKLSDRGKDRLAKILGETLGNAEDHADFAGWWIAAYMRQRGPGQVADCHVCIFNFGKTLAESLDTLPPEARLRRQITKLISKHGKRNWFTPKWTPENLLTLYALQGRVSCLNVDAFQVGNRGQGTADVIQFFQELCTTPPRKATKMSIISGNTQITFDGRYRIARLSPQDDRIIAMNSTNSLAQPPDPTAVRPLRAKFPGVLLTLRFEFDPVFLVSIAQRPAHAS